MEEKEVVPISKIEYLLNRVSKKTVSLSVLITLIATCADIVTFALPIVYMKVFESMLSGSLNYQLWVQWLLISITIVIVRKTSNAVSDKMRLDLKQQMTNSLNTQVTSSFQESLHSKGASYYANLINNTGDMACSLFSVNTIEGFKNLLALAVALVVIAFYDSIICLAAITLSLCVVSLHKHGSRVYNPKSMSFQKQRLDHIAELSDVLKNSSVIKIFGALELEISRYSVRLNNITRFAIKFRSVDYLFFFVGVETLHGIFQLFALARVVWLAYSGNISISNAVLIFGYSKSLEYPLQYVNYVFTQLRDAWASVAILMEEFPASYEYFQKNIESNHPMVSIEKLESIRFSNVTISFEGRVIINNLSFTWRKGSKYWINAPSGSGKTVLLYTILGIFKPDEGTIFYNEIASDKVNLMSVYNHIGICVQGATILPLTILENIQLSSGGDLSHDMYIRLLGASFPKLTGIFDNDISGGEKSRVLIARTLARKTDWVFLDEPLTGVDDTSIRSICEYLREDLSEKSVLLITHNRDLVPLMFDEWYELNFWDVNI